MEQRKKINWTECMNISPAHFIETEDFFTEAIRENALLGLKNYNFGLLPLTERDGDESGILIQEHATGHIEIIVTRCNAITSSGVRIDFNPGKGKYLVYNYSPEADRSLKSGRDIKSWDIILVADPFRRVPTGELDPDENPPRHPYVESGYSLAVAPAGELNTLEHGRNHLTIGRFRKNGERYEVDTNYIPPCASMQSHPDLAGYYMDFRNKFGSIETSAKTIIDKVNGRSGSSELAVNIKSLCEELLRYISSVYFDFRNTGMYAAPIEIVKYVSTLAHKCYIAVNFPEHRKKEEMLNYFYEWDDVTPGSFEEGLSATLELLYEHDNIRTMMIGAESLLNLLDELLLKLSQLEFIGQRKENIVVSARTQQKTRDVKTGWDIGK